MNVTETQRTTLKNIIEDEHAHQTLQWGNVHHGGSIRTIKSLARKGLITYKMIGFRDAADATITKLGRKVLTNS